VLALGTLFVHGFVAGPATAAPRWGELRALESGATEDLAQARSRGDAVAEVAAREVLLEVAGTRRRLREVRDQVRELLDAYDRAHGPLAPETLEARERLSRTVDEGAGRELARDIQRESVQRLQEAGADLELADRRTRLVHLQRYARDEEVREAARIALVALLREEHGPPESVRLPEGLTPSEATERLVGIAGAYSMFGEGGASRALHARVVARVTRAPRQHGTQEPEEEAWRPREFMGPVRDHLLELVETAGLDEAWRPLGEAALAALEALLENVPPGALRELGRLELRLLGLRHRLLPRGPEGADSPALARAIAQAQRVHALLGKDPNRGTGILLASELDQLLTEALRCGALTEAERVVELRLASEEARSDPEGGLGDRLELQVLGDGLLPAGRFAEAHARGRALAERGLRDLEEAVRAGNDDDYLAREHLQRVLVLVAEAAAGRNDGGGLREVVGWLERVQDGDDWEPLGLVLVWPVEVRGDTTLPRVASHVDRPVAALVMVDEDAVVTVRDSEVASERYLSVEVPDPASGKWGEVHDVAEVESGEEPLSAPEPEASVRKDWPSIQGMHGERRAHWRTFRNWLLHKEAWPEAESFIRNSIILEDRAWRGRNPHSGRERVHLVHGVLVPQGRREEALVEARAGLEDFAACAEPICAHYENILWKLRLRLLRELGRADEAAALVEDFVASSSEGHRGRWGVTEIRVEIPGARVFNGIGEGGSEAGLLLGEGLGPLVFPETARHRRPLYIELPGEEDPGLLAYEAKPIAEVARNVVRVTRGALRRP
jgi:hypothetical protein